ncbi:hypothetical protein AALP_AA2G172500 [Arabis alpina]|uniref:Bifunctional inhibitor/plant lipid transfer protein/seed storage helical domain-containing protein n=1 Tax=Arabis alpina TaxID=50452 RepID=A0A087HI39_ARAAL|nr:hypothetical protein AALP_AA2G172500 [Arabis alpina]
MAITKILGVVTIVTIFYSIQATAQIGTSMRCIVKLLPCEPYIHSELTPPPWCCSPMKEIAEKDVSCLCTAFNHPEMLSFISLTEENAINLLTSCGANHDFSVCSKTSLSESASPGSSTNGSSSASSITKNAAIAISFLGFSFVSAFLF